jgi:hypothetical protein
MYLSKLPDSQVLARLVSNVTQTMCGTSFAPDDPLARGDSLHGRMVLIPIVGEPRISVVLSCDGPSCRALARALFQCEDKDLSTEMADDALRELLNMIAGQVTAAMQLDRSLGLPRATDMMEIIEAGGLKTDDAVLLRSRGAIDLRLWVFEHASASSAASAVSSSLSSSSSSDAKPVRVDGAANKSGKIFRSLVAKLSPGRSST